jgi:hypothetical protein
MNAVEIEQAVTDLAARPFDRAEFPFAFLEAFGNKATTIKKLRSGASNASDVPGGVLQRSNIHIATCDPGAVDATLKALRDSPKTAAAKTKFILATDGDDLQAEDLINGESVACSYTDFPNRFGAFLALAGITTVKQIRENSFDIRATAKLNKLYVELLNENPDWATAERRPDMNHFMARLIFCFFAEDTDIFRSEGLFTATVDQMSERDSSNTHAIIANIFRAMDIKPADRAKAGVPAHADVFPYVNGALFSGSVEVPRFTRMARSYLLHIGGLNWKQINPDIFGSMIQAVADDEERGALGMHYTSVPNILKVLNPLFLDDLRAQLEEAGDNARKLLNLRNRMAKIRVFDPACGSGNFLVIAYKHMREIEAEINRRRSEPDRKSDIPLTNFRGIELRDFPAEIARLALIIAEFQCDVLYCGQKEALAVFLPLDSQNWITCGNALRLDWLSICPAAGTGVRVQADDLFGTPLDQAEIDFANEGGETYICGNPPYKGTRYQTVEQKDELINALGQDFANGASLDYIAGWFFKAALLCRNQGFRCALVSTSSICEGQQASILWPNLLSGGNRIIFAHRPFRWRNLASHNAAVSVVIVGLEKGSAGEVQIFSEEGEATVSRAVANINAYLIPAKNVFVTRSFRSIAGLDEMVSGEKLTDGGHLVLTQEEFDHLAVRHPEVRDFTGRLVGAQELIKGIQRYALVISDDYLPLAELIPEIEQRLRKVSKMRLASTKSATQKLAQFPHRFDESRFQHTRKIAVAQLSSETRDYFPCDLLTEADVPMAPSLAIYDGPVWNMALIASRLHLIWIATVCGKLKTDYRYSNTMGWNTFPVPTLTEQNKADLTRCAEDILLAREAHFPATIADLYDPETMPENLRHAHERNDEVLERIYIGRRFKNDTERLEKLFELYTKMTSGKIAA